MVLSAKLACYSRSRYIYVGTDCKSSFLRARAQNSEAGHSPPFFKSDVIGKMEGRESGAHTYRFKPESFDEIIEHNNVAYKYRLRAIILRTRP